MAVGPDGVTPYAVYHACVDGVPGRKVHVDRLHWSTEGPRRGRGDLPGAPTETPQPVPDASAFDPAVPFWHAELWVRGERVRLGDVAVDLPAGRDALLDVTQLEHDVRVIVDGAAVVRLVDDTGDQSDGYPGDRYPGDRDPGDRDPGDRDPGDRDPGGEHIVARHVVAGRRALPEWSACGRVRASRGSRCRPSRTAPSSATSC